jgi:hypothetical protein
VVLELPIGNRKHHGERRLGDRTYISPGNPSDYLSTKNKRQSDGLSKKLELVDCIFKKLELILKGENIHVNTIIQMKIGMLHGPVGLLFLE